MKEERDNSNEKKKDNFKWIKVLIKNSKGRRILTVKPEI